MAQGLWKVGKPDGPGRYKWRNKNDYDGEWRAGKMHGQVSCLMKVLPPETFSHWN